MSKELYQVCSVLEDPDLYVDTFGLGVVNRARLLEDLKDVYSIHDTYFAAEDAEKDVEERNEQEENTNFSMPGTKLKYYIKIIKPK